MLSLNRLNLALCLSCLSLFFCGFTHLFGNEDPRSTLEIRLVDLDGSSSDINKLEFSYEVYSAALSQPLRQSGVVVETSDGIVPLPDSLPNFGRIIIWVNVDSLQKGFRHGVGEYSYKLDKNKSEPPALIKLEQGDVVTGQVLDLNDSPIPGAEVTTTVLTQYSDLHADWEFGGAVKCDRNGHFRIVGTNLLGVAARAPGYRVRKDTLKKMKDVRLNLEPLIPLRIRVVDDGLQPLAGATINYSETKTGDDGRLILHFTESELSAEESETFSVYRDDYGYKSVAVSELDRAKETIIRLKKDPKISGVIYDANGAPVVGATVELMRHDDDSPVVNYYQNIGVTDDSGAWEGHVFLRENNFSLRVSLNGEVLTEQVFIASEVKDNSLTIRLSSPDSQSKGFQVSGKITSFDPSNSNSFPRIYLFNKNHPEFDRSVNIEPNGQFAFRNLQPGKYALQIRPHEMPAVAIEGFQRGFDSVLPTSDFSDQVTRWNRRILIVNHDIDVGVIDLQKENLRPVRLVGVALDRKKLGRPVANAFGFICPGDDNILWSSEGPDFGFYFKSFMTDADGRFDVKDCPPGVFAIRFSNRPYGYEFKDPVVWVSVTGRNKNGGQAVTVDASFPQSLDEIQKLGVDTNIDKDAETKDIDSEGTETEDLDQPPHAVTAYWTPGKVLFITAIILIFTAIVGLVKRRDRIATINNGSNPPISK